MLLLLYCFALCVLHSHSTPVIEYHEWAVEGKTYFGSSSKRLDVCNGGRAWQQDQEARVSTPWEAEGELKACPLRHTVSIKAAHPEVPSPPNSTTNTIWDSSVNRWAWKGALFMTKNLLLSYSFFTANTISFGHNHTQYTHSICHFCACVWIFTC